LIGDDDEAVRREARKVVQRLLEQPRPELAPSFRELIGCAAKEDHPERGGILLRLGEAARFHADPAAALAATKDHHERAIELSNMDDVSGISQRFERNGVPIWLEVAEEDRAWGRQAIAVLWERWPTLCWLTETPETREAAVFVQAMLLRFAPEQAPPGFAEQAKTAQTTAWLRGLDEGPQERLQVGLLWALALVAPADRRVLAALERSVENSESLLVRYAAALKLVDLTGDVGDRGLDALLEAQQDGGAIYEQCIALPRWENYVVEPRLERLGPRVVERRLPMFVDMVRGAGEAIGSRATPGSKRPASSGQIRELLRLAFGGRMLAPGATAADLSDAQRQLLQAAVDNGHFWGRLANNSLELERILGLPAERRELRRFLARPGETLAPPRIDPEEAFLRFEAIARQALPFPKSASPDEPEEPDEDEPEEEDRRAPFRLIEEKVEQFQQLAESYRPADRPRIRSLSPCGYASDALVALVPLCPNLVELDLGWGEATDASMHHVAKLRLLEKLELHATWVGDAGVAQLAGLTKLRELSLGLTDVSDDGLQHLQGLTELQRLHLGYTRVRGPGLKALSTARALKILWCIGPCVTDEAIDPVAGLTSLLELSLGGARFTGAGLEAWRPLTNLKQLRLSGALTETNLRKLPLLPALTHLDFLDCPTLNDAFVQALPVVPHLKSLSFFKARLSDAALEGIERFAALENIDLSWTAVTDAAVPHLLRLQHLKWVGMHQTRMSVAAVQRLRDAFPNGYFSA
jgi:hypothetical protein